MVEHVLDKEEYLEETKDQKHMAENQKFTPITWIKK